MAWDLSYHESTEYELWKGKLMAYWVSGQKAARTTSRSGLNCTAGLIQIVAIHRETPACGIYDVSGCDVCEGDQL